MIFGECLCQHAACGSEHVLVLRSDLYDITKDTRIPAMALLLGFTKRPPNHSVVRSADLQYDFGPGGRLSSIWAVVHRNPEVRARQEDLIRRYHGGDSSVVAAYTSTGTNESIKGVLGDGYRVLQEERVREWQGLWCSPSFSVSYPFLRRGVPSVGRGVQKTSLVLVDLKASGAGNRCLKLTITTL